MAPPTWIVGQVLAAADVNNWFVPLAAVKASDQSVTNSTTMVNDNDLVLSVAANCTYQFFCYLDYEGGAQGVSDLRWQFVVPASATLRYSRVGIDNANNVQINTLTAVTVASGRTNGAASLQAVTMHGTLVTLASSGTIQLQWAQFTSNATSTIVHAQSYMYLQRIS